MPEQATLDHVGADDAEHWRIRARTDEQPSLRTERPATVMVVDDEDDFLDVAAELLSSMGLRVVTARSASEAMWLALASPPDLVFLDLILPGADGFQLLSALRAEPETRDVPVLSISGAYIEDHAILSRAGFAGHFAKPLCWPELRRLLERLGLVDPQT